MYTFSVELFSDLYKEVHGFRPRSHWFYDSRATDQERQEEWDYLIARNDEQIRVDNVEKAKAWDSFQEQVKQNLQFGARDEQEAIRWVVESLNPNGYDLRYGGEWVCYAMGLAFDKGYVFNQACKDLEKKLEKEAA